MTPGARLGAVIELYDDITGATKPADQILFQYFRSRKFIGSGDRRFITETIYTLSRHYARLNWWAKRLGANADGRIMTLLWLVFGTTSRADDIMQMFDGAGYGPQPLSRFERELADRAMNQDFTPADMPEAVRGECPDWAYPGLKKAFGARLGGELDALLDEAPLDLRINTLKIDTAKALKQLQRDRFDVVPTFLSPLNLRATGRPAFSAHPLHQSGAIEVQDEGSQMLALLCGVKPGEWVVDFCAGAGGKTLALAAQMQNKGRIWACDVEQNRLDNNRKRLRRAGVHCAELKLLNNEEDGWVAKHKGKADCVLIDAPCSGVGTWRRSPFARWQSLGPSVKALTKLQTSILHSAARLVKPGGRLIYATCSMLPEENQAQVDLFLAENKLFKPIPLAPLWDMTGFAPPAHLDLTQASLQLTPAQHTTDGFFISAMQRL